MKVINNLIFLIVSTVLGMKGMERDDHLPQQPLQIQIYSLKALAGLATLNYKLLEDYLGSSDLEKEEKFIANAIFPRELLEFVLHLKRVEAAVSLMKEKLSKWNDRSLEDDENMKNITCLLYSNNFFSSSSKILLSLWDNFFIEPSFTANKSELKKMCLKVLKVCVHHLCHPEEDISLEHLTESELTEFFDSIYYEYSTLALVALHLCATKDSLPDASYLNYLFLILNSGVAIDTLAFQWDKTVPRVCAGEQIQQMLEEDLKVEDSVIEKSIYCDFEYNLIYFFKMIYGAGLKSYLQEKVNASYRGENFLELIMRKGWVELIKFINECGIKCSMTPLLQQQKKILAMIESMREDNLNS